MPRQTNPTAPGWYWGRFHDSKEYTPLRVGPHPFGDPELQVICVGCTWGLDDIQWAHPVEPIKPPAAAPTQAGWYWGRVSGLRHEIFWRPIFTHTGSGELMAYVDGNRLALGDIEWRRPVVALTPENTTGEAS